MDVMMRGIIAMRKSRRNTSAKGWAMGIMPSPNIHPAKIPKKNPMNI
jgi:hypothetical protein